MNLLDQIRADIKTKLEGRSTRQTELDTLLEAPQAEGRSALNEAEETKFSEIRAALQAIDAELEPLQAREAELAEADERRQAAEDTAKRLDAAPGGEIRVTKEEPVYRQDGEFSFFADAFNARAGDWKAQQRLHRHEEASDTEARDVGTGAFAGLTVPQFLIDLFAPVARAGRPFANSVRSLPLPDKGMVISISRGTTGTAVAAQATENSAVQETNFDDTKLDVDVRTIAGQQDVSRQALERSEMVDVVLFADLVEAYHSNLDSQCIVGDGTNGTHLSTLSTTGITAVTYTDASPTVAEIYPKLANAVQSANSTRFLPPTCIWMHPRRWGWFTASLDSQNRPLVVPIAPVNPVGVGSAAEYGQVVGSILGLPVITDANIPTNLGAGTDEDMIIVGRANDLLLWEEDGGMPRQLRFEETTGGSLTVKLVVYGYSAFTAGRYPKAVATIGGTGLIAPTF